MQTGQKTLETRALGQIHKD